MITKEQRELNLKWIRKIRHERANKPKPQWLLDYELAVEMEIQTGNQIPISILMIGLIGILHRDKVFLFTWDRKISTPSIKT